MKNDGIKEYRANGKLLLTGEYLILFGAEALVLPVTYGQKMKIIPADTGGIQWVSYDRDGEIWWQGEIDISSAPPTGDAVEKNIYELLRTAAEMRGDPQGKHPSGIRVETHLEFPRDWGLGSSSTLVYMTAQWWGIDPYALLKNTWGGSGYDVAAAAMSRPFFYKLESEIPVITPVDFYPPFARNLFFVHLNRKQDTRAEVKKFLNKVRMNESLIRAVGNLGMNMYAATELSLFQELMREHERLLSDVLQRKPVGESLFSDYPGAVKSLGAWGGDFVLAAGTEDSPAYFKAKGYHNTIPYCKMVMDE